MKLNHLVDTKVDQNEIESKYIWNSDKEDKATMQRFNLDEFKIDYAKNLKFTIDSRYLMALPNNQFLGMMTERSDAHFNHNLFISDESFNIRHIENSLYQKCDSFPSSFASCFYNDSIFILEDDFENYGKLHCFKRYIISQNKWINLSPFYEPFQPFTSCIGFNQKIIIAVNSPGVWIYDIFLDSFVGHSTKYWPALKRKRKNLSRAT